MRGAIAPNSYTNVGEARLLYVAMTRAIEVLVLTGDQEITVYGVD
jgi:ATP-dependent exoDNAse (exonuclease V) beta subunit